MDTKQSNTSEIKLEITPSGGGKKSIILEGDVGSLHEDPQKIHQLLDLLEMPEGTEVKVTTNAAAVIVR